MSRSVFRQWFDFCALLAIGMCVVYATVIVPGRERTARLKAERDRLDADLMAVKSDVDRLAREIAALENDPYAIERRLREETHFLRPGEKVFEDRAKLPKPSRSTVPSLIQGLEQNN